MKDKIKNLKIKEKANEQVKKFKSQSKSKQIAIISGSVAIVLALIFMFNYMQNNKYTVLFSGIEAQDAANITAELEKRKVDMKVKGSSIYVDKNEVDKLRLELAPTISDGSKGFELMDESSSIGLTDEEFQIKKQRMIQGEIEKTIKSFPQVETARVHISPGEKSVFEKEQEPGRAAVYLILKEGTKLEKSQVKSIISLVAGSTQNIPKENIDVIDGNMNLLSEGIMNEENAENGTNGAEVLTLSQSKDAETQLNKNLELSILKMLEPIFGTGKVKATVNTNLNFDSIVTTDLTIKPDKVAIKETRLKASSQNGSTQGNGATDSNMNNNNAVGNKSVEDSTEESFEYTVGQTEIQTISTPGEVERITASVAIDGQIPRTIIADVQKIVENAIGMDGTRGDSVSVVGMEFDPTGKAALEAELEAIKVEQAKDKLNKAMQMWISVIVIAVIVFIMYKRVRTKKTQEILSEIQQDKNKANAQNQNNEVEPLKASGKKKRNYILGDNDEMTLEEEVQLYASEKPDQVTEIIKTWLSE